MHDNPSRCATHLMESIATCTRKFNYSYAHTIAHDFTRSLLHHWNQFLHSGDTLGYSDDPPLMYLPVRQKPTARPPIDNQAPRPKSVSFADVTQAAARQAPGDVHVAPARKQPVAASNHALSRTVLKPQQLNASCIWRMVWAPWLRKSRCQTVESKQPRASEDGMNEKKSVADTIVARAWDSHNPRPTARYARVPLAHREQKIESVKANSRRRMVLMVSP